jgi:aldose 1-epimerase
MDQPIPNIQSKSFDASAHTITAGDLEAVFLPDKGMIGASLRHRGVELLRRIEDLELAAAKGSTAGIPLLYPWANRLSGFQYSVGGRDVVLDDSSPLLHLDDRGLPMHGVPWALLAWSVTEAKNDSLVASLDWSKGDLLAIFPFRHRVELAATIFPDSLVLNTKLMATSDDPVPVSFGFHPYFGLPDSPRGAWSLQLPAMRKLVLDSRGIPTGEEQPFEGYDSELGDDSFDDCFAVRGSNPSFSLSGAGRKITVEFLGGYEYAQIFAPKTKDYVALEPMTAPTNALTSLSGLSFVEPGNVFDSSFRIRIELFDGSQAQ